MKVVWAKRARDRLDEIYDYIRCDSAERAEDLCTRLVDATEQLGLHPLSGPLLPEDPAYRQLVVEGYRIVYRVTDRLVYVMTVIGPGMAYKQAI